MIEPTSKDRDRRVSYRRPGGATVFAFIKNFSIDDVTIALRLGGDELTVDRNALDWLDEPDAGKGADVRLMLEKAGLRVEDSGQGYWIVSLPTTAGASKTFQFFPEGNLWRWSDGRLGGYTIRGLIETAQGKKAGADST